MMDRRAVDIHNGKEVIVAKHPEPAFALEQGEYHTKSGDYQFAYHSRYT